MPKVEYQIPFIRDFDINDASRSGHSTEIISCYVKTIIEVNSRTTFNISDTELAGLCFSA